MGGCCHDACHRGVAGDANLSWFGAFPCVCPPFLTEFGGQTRVRRPTVDSWPRRTPGSPVRSVRALRDHGLRDLGISQATESAVLWSSEYGKHRRSTPPASRVQSGVGFPALRHRSRIWPRVGFSKVSAVAELLPGVHAFPRASQGLRPARTIELISLTGGGATFASLIGGRGEHCHASRGMESGRITRLWPDPLAAIAGMGIRPWPSTQPMGVPELVISCRDSHLVPTFGGRRTLDMVEKGQEMASAGRCRGEDVRQPRRSSCARKPEIPNLVDRFGRSTDDRLAILRDRVEPNLPKDFRDAIAAGPVFNVEDGVIWRDED